MKSCYHVPAKFMAALYASMLGRFVLYGAYGYAVSLAFTYAYYHFIAPGSGTDWFSNGCPFAAYTGSLYALVIGFFVMRDSLEANSVPLMDALAQRTLKTTS